MACVGDGLHRVGDCRVLVENRIIVQCMKQDAHGNWTVVYVKRWNKTFHWYERAGKVTLAALRSGLRRGTMTIS